VVIGPPEISADETEEGITRRATRPYVYRKELDRFPGCRGVTHAVYAFNLGAFALGHDSVSRVVAPGLGVAMSSAQQLSPEGRLFLVFTP
jgi:hypothetical protein